MPLYLFVVVLFCFFAVVVVVFLIHSLYTKDRRRPNLNFANIQLQPFLARTALSKAFTDTATAIYRSKGTYMYV